MKRDFVSELRQICNQDKARQTIKREGSLEPKRFAVWKRSLPVGINKLVVLNILKEEAEWWIENVLKTKCYQDDSQETKTIIYFDILPVNATAKERSIYFNPPEVQGKKCIRE